jgi:predicted Rossmann fold nucleotide-binding protein DprA/Smf involved in DNA uptake
MNLTPQTQAVLLLTSHFSKPRSGDVKPLTPSEWGKFALWLMNEKRDPEALLSGNLRETLSGWSDRSVTVDRVAKLLDRGSALAIATEKWLRSGLWVLARSDPEYPRLLKKRLQTSSPPVLFGCGNIKLLNRNGIAVVGSRNASEEDLAYAAQVGVSATEAALSVVSGGARGIDEAAMLGALRVDGTAVGVLADSLLRASSSQKYRRYLSQNNLALVSPYYPEAGFNAGNAMGRNKYIYCLADAAVVVHSGQQGGTWSGALENLSKAWVPLWVKPTEDSFAGNAELVERGARWATSELNGIDVSVFVEGADVSQSFKRDADLFALEVREPRVEYTEPAYAESSDRMTGENGAGSSVPATKNNASVDMSFYEFFLARMQDTCEGQPLSADDLANRLGLTRTQLNEWLRQAVSEKYVKKFTRPVRYQWQGGVRQRSMFSD